ncbi:MADS-domain transcription factor [Selaginella moellendorffii]|uniref:MADS-domain transcription factor n=1 Tax=Selaginella moellendorffii TaxID=88036 RepID=D8S5G0_SELML|nr:serum factor response D [Selaginella moellendorffii]EFJ20589.1 MADS-domain transcription factor [Selaginella moellendorffii]|eukprot:XP_002978603.1 serum factor response D [Selaginella moellendorffii]
MGRRKIDIKYLVKNNPRTQTFRKRTEGLFKKAIELQVLCGAKVEVTVIYDSGKKHFFYSSDPSAPQKLPPKITVESVIASNSSSSEDSFGDDEVDRMFAEAEGQDQDGMFFTDDASSGGFFTSSAEVLPDHFQLLNLGDHANGHLGNYVNGHAGNHHNDHGHLGDHPNDQLDSMFPPRNDHQQIFHGLYSHRVHGDGNGGGSLYSNGGFVAQQNDTNNMQMDSDFDTAVFLNQS